MNFTRIFILSTLLLLNSSCNNLGDKEQPRPLDTSAMVFNAKVFMQKDEYLKAKLIYDSLIKIDSTKGVYYFKRGYSRSLLLYDDEGAIADYLKSIYYGYHNKQSAYLNIGSIYSLNKKFDSAIFYFNKCLEIDPENRKARLQMDEAIKELK